jgi:L-malate glycosyltransferase
MGEMKVLHLNAGAETGGGMTHILQLLNNFKGAEVTLGLFEKELMYEKARQLGIQVELFTQNSRLDISILPKIIDYIQMNNIDIVHTHGARANFYGYLLKKRLSCKWITTVHSNPRLDFLGKGVKGKIFTLLHLFALKKPDHFFAISDRFKQMLSAEGIQEKKITVIYNGINFNEVPPAKLKRTDLKLKQDDFIVVMVARLDPVKGHTIAFKAVQDLLKQIPNLKLLLIGDGFIHNDLENEVKQLGITENVLFLGHQKNVHSYLSISNIKLLTSYSESFPLVLLEAARAKLPVISTDVGGVKQLIPNEKYGWIVPIKKVDSVKNAIHDAYTLPQNELKQKGQNLYERASAVFTTENTQESILKTYQKILQIDI